MLQHDGYRLLADYNIWMNRKLYALCAEIPDATRKRDMGAFFGSIHSTLNHILYADRAWLARFQDRPDEIPPLGRDLFADFDALAREREHTDQALQAWAQTLTPDWLAAPFTFTSNVDGKTRSLPAWVLVTHLFNHQTHHRGQLTTLLKQLGIDPGVTDLPWLPGLAQDAL